MLPAEGGACLAQPTLALRLRQTPVPVATSGPAVATGADGDGLLSQREREVLAFMAAGDSNKHIARALDISPHTVKRHVANILNKLGLDSRGEAAAWWRDRQASTRPGTLA